MILRKSGTNSFVTCINMQCEGRLNYSIYNIGNGVNADFNWQNAISYRYCQVNYAFFCNSSVNGTMSYE